MASVDGPRENNVNQPLKRIALDVPATGTALGDAGDAYVASLQIDLRVDGRSIATVDGTAFEAIMSALRLRHLCFHPRTRAFKPGSMGAWAMAQSIDRHWASIDSHASEIDGIRETADAMLAACRGAETAAWFQAN